VAGKPTAAGFLRLEIQDTGVGIPAEFQSRLFQPFERLSAAETGEEGTGLGLALSKNLVSAMKGRIGVQSQVSVGSTFWLELPLAASPSAKQAAAPSPPAALTNITGKTVLYVEDNLSNLRLVETLLTRFSGIKLVTAMQGRLAVLLAREHRPDLVLLDLHLPDMKGEQVLQELKADAATRQTPVVVISADATPGRIERLLALGARDFLTKPLEVKHFLRLLEALLNGKTTPS